MKKIRLLTTVTEALSYVSAVALIAVFASVYSHLAAALGYGETQLTYMMIIFWIGFMIFGVLFILKRYPKYMLFPVKTTPQNMMIQGALSKLMLSVVSIWTSLLFAIALLDLYYAAAGTKRSLGAYIAALVALIAATVGLYIIAARKKA